MLGFKVSVPAYLRQGLVSRAFDDLDLLRRLRFRWQDRYSDCLRRGLDVLQYGGMGRVGRVCQQAHARELGHHRYQHLEVLGA